MIKVLISNDDGVYAPGLAALAEAISKVAEIQVIAPDRNRSGASNSLTLDRPLEAHTHHNGFISLNGTPTDCVHMGVSGIFGMVPDLVVSGINAGANLGDDVIYSGTVAAAMEGRSMSLPPIAVSLASYHPEHYRTAAQVAAMLVRDIQRINMAPRTVLNVNVPDVPMDDIQGIHVTRLGHREMASGPVAAVDPRGCTRYWVAGAGKVADRDPGTDFHAIEQKYVSITPIQIDMTQYSGMDNLAGWLEELQ
ncbi:5'-nucleotidase SurE [Marinobacterium nitratireducens]|uniref:5'-nucleotidase SurE n=1 Tax=Marinobacterium nitratireducens TaxID=518897 RepID=A0A918DUJ0_9GAMM|nr:5'-nucleotidase SurE [Marinobacterium nitratireducens]